MARTDLPALVSNSKLLLGITHPRKLTDHGNTPPCRDDAVKKKKKNKIKQDHYENVRRQR